MAKIIGKPLFLGTIGDLTFYERMGKYFVRQKADFGKKEIMTQPNRRRQRENMNGFGGASSFAASIRHAWKQMGNIAMDATTIPRLNRVMYAIQRAGEGIRGYQSIQLSQYGERLTGFTLGENRSPGGHLTHSPEWQWLPPVTSSGAFGPLIEPNISPNAKSRGLSKRVSKPESTPNISPNAKSSGLSKRVSKQESMPNISPNAQPQGLNHYAPPPQHTPPTQIKLTFPENTRHVRKKAPSKAKYYAIHLHVTVLSDRHWDEGSGKFEPAHPAGSNSTACLCTNPIPLTSTLTLPDSLCLTLPASAQPGQNLIITWGIEYFAEENGQPKPIIISKPDSRCRQTETYCEVLAVTKVPHPPQNQHTKIARSAEKTRSTEIPISVQRGARNSISATQKAKHSPKGEPTHRNDPAESHLAPQDSQPTPHQASTQHDSAAGPTTTPNAPQTALPHPKGVSPKPIQSANHQVQEIKGIEKGKYPCHDQHSRHHHRIRQHNPQRGESHSQYDGLNGQQTESTCKLSTPLDCLYACEIHPNELKPGLDHCRNRTSNKQQDVAQQDKIVVLYGAHHIKPLKKGLKAYQ